MNLPQFSSIQVLAACLREPLDRKWRAYVQLCATIGKFAEEAEQQMGAFFAHCCRVHGHRNNNMIHPSPKAYYTCDVRWLNALGNV